MTTENVKKTLNEKTGVNEKNFKRISKKKNSNGEDVRIFEDKLTGKMFETIEDKNGNIEIKEYKENKIKPIGYYQYKEGAFAIVTIDFWEENGCLDDSGSECEYVPKGFYSLAEAIYETDIRTIKEACKKLEENGFIKKQIV